MHHRATLRRSSLLACLTLVLLVPLTGCATIQESIADELGSTLADSELKEVVDRFTSMQHTRGEPVGNTQVVTTEPGVLWALTRRDDATHASPDLCEVDGALMSTPHENLNIPEPSDLGFAGTPQTMFATAVHTVTAPGEYQVTCNLPEVDALLFLFEPAAVTQ